MKKNRMIVILTIVSILSISYGYYQKSRADESVRIATELKNQVEELRLLAEQHMLEAQEQRQMAEIQAMEAMRQRQLAEEELRKLKED